MPTFGRATTVLESLNPRLTVEDREQLRKDKAMQQATSPSGFSNRNVRLGTCWGRRLLQKIVASVYFKLAVFLLIAINAAVIGFQVNHVATYGDAPSWFDVLDVVFTSLFLLELLMRVGAEGSSFIVSKDWAWNLLDASLVAASLVEVVLSRLQTTPRGPKLAHARAIRIVRVTRMIRNLRIVRVVYFVRALRTLLHSILCTLRSVMWALLLILMVLYGFGIAFTQAVSSYRADEGLIGESCGRQPELDAFWGTLLRSMFTLYKSITNGLSWHDAVLPLSDVGWPWVGLFVLFIAFSVFAVLNVITGVFCQSAIESAQRDKELATMQLIASRDSFTEALTDLFRQIDSDEKGFITLSELEQCLTEEKFQAYISSLGLESNDAWTLVQLLDNDDSGTIEMEEFIQGCKELRGEAKAIHIAKLAFDQKHMNDALERFMDSVDLQLGNLLRVSMGGRPRSKKISVEK